MKLFLDTHVLLWWFGVDSPLPDSYRSAIREAGPDNPLWVSDISLWEIATLNELGRIKLRIPLRDWLERATAPPLVRRFGVSPAVADAVSSLPPSFHRDPADRIIVATARVLGATLLTHDQRIIEADLVPVLL